MSSRVIGVSASDWHLCHRAPVARSAEPDWYAAMRRPISQIRKLCEQYEAPLIIPGDIFDRWDAGGGAENRKSSPAAELINFAISELEQFNHGVYAIPGQHDLPNHRLDEMHRAAYYTLVAARVIEDIKPGQPVRHDDLVIHGFPWGVPIEPTEPDDDLIHLAAIHAYIWREGSSYPGADEAEHVHQRRGRCQGFHATVWGDNHKGFMVGDRLMNCGTLMRRKSDEIDYRPHVGLLHEHGYISPYCLDVSQDLWLEEALVKHQDESVTDVSSFIETLKRLQADPLDFREAASRALEQRKIPLDSPVRSIVLDCLAVQR